MTDALRDHAEEPVAPERVVAGMDSDAESLCCIAEGDVGCPRKQYEDQAGALPR